MRSSRRCSEASHTRGVGGRTSLLRLRPLLLAALLATPACDGFLAIDDSTQIDAGQLDPVRDGATLSRSAMQDFAAVYGPLIVYSAWFAGEALVADFLPDRNDFGRRDIAPSNASLLNELWAPLSTARASADYALALLATAPETRASTHVARAALVAGYAFLFMAEHFCEGAVNGGPPLDLRAMLDSAASRFTTAIDIGAVTQPSADETAEALQIATVARVGRARAYLQSDRKSEAAADAALVPAGFSFGLRFVDDPANRARLSNRVWFFTGQRGALAIAPAFRALDDPRVTTRPPGPPLRAADGVTAFWTQTKYPDHASAIRLASRLEADYIAAEALGTAAMLELSARRRAENGQQPYAGPTDDEALLAELMDQRSRDFHLEGRALGDLRRNPQAVRYAPLPGSPYHKPGFAPIGSQACYPLPDKETASNPNFPRR